MCTRCMTTTIAPRRLSSSRDKSVLVNHWFALVRFVSDKASSARSGSSMHRILPPRPVRVPPTDVASREPRAVSSISVSEFLNGPILAEGPSERAARYQWRLKQGAEIVGMLFGEVAGIAHANDALAMGWWPEDKSGKRNRSRDRFFQRPRLRHVDDQPPDLATANAFELPSERFDVPTVLHIGLGREQRVLGTPCARRL